VNSNMRRHYRNHITSSRNQGASLLAPNSLSTAELLRINRDEVPALVPATLPGPPSVAPHILVSKPDGPDPSTGRSMSHRGVVSYHDDDHNQYLATTGEQKRVHGSHQIRRQQQGLGGADSYAVGTPVEVDNQVRARRAYYPDTVMHCSPPTSHSSLSDSADDGFEMFADDKKGSRLSPAMTRVRLSSLDSASSAAAYRPTTTTMRLAAPPLHEDSEQPKRERETTHFPTTNTRLAATVALSSSSSDYHSSDNRSWMITASVASSRRRRIPSSPSISEVSSRLSSPEVEGEGEVARRHSEPSTLGVVVQQPARYSASRPYFESLTDSHVSTTLRPAFMRSSSSSLLHCTR